MPEKLEFAPRVRSTSHVRDASLIIIATEGTKTEKRYFEDLSYVAWYQNSNVLVKVLDHLQADSNPEDVLAMLDGFRNQYHLHAGDSLWLVIDVDRWGKKLAEIARLCLQKKYELCVSNPCFELWLLLHVTSLNQYTAEVKSEFRINAKDGAKRTRLGRELVTILGRYNKSHPDASDFLPHLSTAIEQAQALDINPADRWPNDLGSRVYRLVTQIIDR